MSVSTIISAFQTFNAALSGVSSAPEDMPDTLTADKLPCAITLPGAARWFASGLGGRRKVQRTYVVRFYVAPASDIPVSGVFDMAFDLMEAAGAAYREAGSIGGCMVLNRGGDSVEDLGLLRTLRYAGQEYYGVEFRVPVLEESS